MHFGSESGRSARARQKTAQLCRQVFRTLAASMQSLGDDALLDAYVDEVRPYPDASRLLVVLRLPAQANSQACEALAALQRRQGRLRAEVAAAITRKRAPELAFQLVYGSEAT